MSYVNGKTDSKYAELLIGENHKFHENSKVLRTENEGYHLNVLEFLEINKIKK